MREIAITLSKARWNKHESPNSAQASWSDAILDNKAAQNQENTFNVFADISVCLDDDAFRLFIFLLCAAAA